MSDIRSQYNDAYFRRGTIEDQFYERRELRPDQLSAIEYLEGAKRILSVGVGRGFLEDELIRRGHEVVGLDIRDNRHYLHFPLILGGLECVPDEDFDAILFVESIEHIPPTEWETYWPTLRTILRRTKGRLVITNWLYLHPIQLNYADHVMCVTDEFYDALSREAATVKLRNKSHLVLEFA